MGGKHRLRHRRRMASAGNQAVVDARSGGDVPINYTVMAAATADASRTRAASRRRQCRRAARTSRPLIRDGSKVIFRKPVTPCCQIEVEAFLERSGSSHDRTNTPRRG